VFAIKRNERGDIERYNARLVALGIDKRMVWTIPKHTHQLPA
jgi:hypothetical protein